MVKCLFCQFENEDGAHFCEQCKSDLPSPSSTAPTSHADTRPPILDAIPVVESAHEYAPLHVEAIPLVDPEIVTEADPPYAELAEADPNEGVQIAPPTPAPHLYEPEVQQQAPAPTTVSPPTVPAAFAPPTPAAGPPLPAGAQPRLLVLRGQKRNVEYSLYEGLNFVGRADEKPVDIDLEDQEPPDRVWCSRQHACISFEADQLAVEDLNSANGTYVNRTKVYPGQKRPLAVGDIIQIGNVQMKVIL
jgi:hypothetical protein